MTTMTACLLMAVHGKVVMVPSGSIVAVAGSTSPGAAGLLFAAAAATSAFAFFGRCNYFLLYHFTTYVLLGSVALKAVRAKPHRRRCNAGNACRKAGAKIAVINISKIC
jgi:hypothetical protein